MDLPPEEINVLTAKKNVHKTTERRHVHFRFVSTVIRRFLLHTSMEYYVLSCLASINSHGCADHNCVSAGHARPNGNHEDEDARSKSAKSARRKEIVAREREMLTRTPSGVRQPGTVPVKAYNP
jgi:hypothetical protein